MNENTLVPSRKERGSATLPVSGTELALGGAAVFVVALILIALNFLSV